MSDRASRGSGSHAAVARPSSSPPRRRIFSLTVHGKEIFLHTGTHTVGRALSCDIVLNDRLVSREHARIVVRDASAAVIDLGSTNGVYVNEVRVEGSAEVRHDDLIIIGSQEMTLKAAVSDDERTTSPGQPPRTDEEISEVIEREPPPSGRVSVGMIESGPRDAAAASEPVSTLRAQIGVLRSSDSRSDNAPHLTEKADAIQVLGRLADRAMVMGNYEAAERVLESHLRALLVGLRNGLEVGDSQQEIASRYALRLADALRKPEWIDYAVEVHLIAGKPMGEWCATRLSLILPATAGVDGEQFFFYQQMLKGRLDQLPAAERVFAEQIVALKPKP